MAGGLLTLSNNGSIAQSSGVTLAGAGAQFDISAANGARTIKDLSGVAGSTVQLGNNALIVGTANSTTFAGILDDSSNPGGSLVKQGSGTLTLSAANTYSGGTTINAGLINFIALEQLRHRHDHPERRRPAVGGRQHDRHLLVPRLVLGAAGATFDTDGNNVTFATGLGGAGGITKQGLGTLTLAGTNTFSGGTVLNAGGLVVSGSLASGVTVNAGNLLVSGTVGSSVAMNGGSTVVNGRVTGAVTVNGGTLGGNGTIGGLTMNGGTVGPGNSIGTLNVTGNVVQNAGSIYQVEANAAGQADRINAGGTAAINGGTVQVIAAARQLRQEHDLHHPQCHRRRQRRLLRRDQQLRLPDADAVLRRQRRVPHPGAAAQTAFTPQLRGADAQPEGGRRRAQPEHRQCQRRLRHGDRRAGRPQHRAGPDCARYDQRPALCRLRHPEHQQQHDVHECAGPADGQRARLQRSAGQRQALAQACEIESCDARRPVERVGRARSAVSARCWATPMPRR